MNTCRVVKSGAERNDRAMKKYGMLLCAVLALSLAMTGLAEEAQGPEMPVFAWMRDVQTHWRVLENGEMADIAAHVLTDGVCAVCGSEILVFDDGWADVSDYNAQDDLIRSTTYDENGEVVFESTYAYAYDEDGHVMWEREFDGDILLGETIYTVDGGQHRLLYTLSYDEEGGMTRADYDAHENLVLLRNYDADGTLLYEESTEYDVDQQGWYYRIRTNAVFEDGTSLLGEYNAQGDWLRAAIVEADGTTSSDTTYEYTYSAEGFKLTCKIYEFGTLTMEETYDENGWLIREVEHLEDGTTNTYEYEYDASGELIG